MVSTAAITSFNGGEVSPRLHGRTDQALYAISCETMVGWLPLIQGGAVTAPGTHYVADAAGPCRLLPFEYNVTQGYVVEASAGALRFYTNDVRIGPSPDAAYEIANPWSYAEIKALDYQQSADVLYLVGGGRQGRKLARTGAETFALLPLELKNGPIGDGNGDEAITVTASAAEGVGVTLLASAGIFAATDIGGLFELEAADYNDVPSWEPGLTIASGDKRTWAGKVYECAGGGTRTGSVPPAHDSGTEWDGSGSGTDINGEGPYGVKWTFLHGRHGLLKITGYASATQVTATVLKRLADSVVTTASWRWSFGAFSDTRGWPDTVSIWNESLVLTKGSTAYVSVVGDYENFERRDSSGDFQRDLAGSFTLPNPDAIKWTAADRLLLMGTAKAEYTVERVLTNSGTAGPPVFDVRLQATNGSKAVKPIQADGRLLFVQRAGRKLLELAYAISSDRYEAPDLTRLADHIGRGGFRELAWQQEPERIAWAAADSGALAALTYSPAQQVMAWSRRRLGDGLRARSLCRITDPEGRRDQIWIAAEHDGAWRVLRMAKIWELGDDPAEAVLSDAALTYDGEPKSVFAGLDHLEGRTVEILADGKPHRELVVEGGKIKLGYAAAKLVVGLPYTAVLQPLKIEAGQSEGIAQGKVKRIVDMTLRLIEAGGLRVRVQNSGQVPIETRIDSDRMDQAVPLFTGDIKLHTIGAYETGGQLIVERFQPVPATLDAVFLTMEVGQ